MNGASGVSYGIVTHGINDATDSVSFTNGIGNGGNGVDVGTSGNGFSDQPPDAQVLNGDGKNGADVPRSGNGFSGKQIDDQGANENRLNGVSVDDPRSNGVINNGNGINIPKQKRKVRV